MSTHLLYTPNKPGRLVPTITRRGRNIGFIPDPLPLALELPADIPAALVAVRDAAAHLDRAIAAMPLPPDAVAFLRLREAIRSSAADRNLSATFKLLTFQLDDGNDRKGNAAWNNAFTYRRALYLGEELCRESSPLPLCNLIQRLHQGLFGHRPRRLYFAGRFRRGPIQMGAGERYVPPPYEHVVPLLKTLERQINRPADIDPLIRCFMVKYQIESIHPFADGNGRIGRIVLALMLNRALGLAYPALDLSAAFCNHRERYTASMFRVNTHGDWLPWIRFCLNASVAQSRDAALRLRALKSWKERCLNQSGIGESIPAQRLLDHLVATPVVTAQSCAGLYDSDTKLAAAALQTLQSAKVLVRTNPGGRTPRFVAPALVRMLLLSLNAGAHSHTRRPGDIVRRPGERRGPVG